MNQAPKLGLIAGGGAAPRQLIRACQSLGRPFFVFCLEGQADPNLAADVPHCWMGIGEAGKLRDICAQQNIAEIVMIGRVHRPSIRDVKPDWLGMKLVTQIGLNSLGDDGLLRSLSQALEKLCAVRVIGAHEVMTDLLAPAGVLTRIAPDAQAMKDVALAFEAAKALGREDKGQAALVQKGVVLGLETSAGTDALIAHAGQIKQEGAGGVLVKASKPQQDFRFDLPSIGPGTITALKAAGFAGVAVEAGCSLIIEREKTLAAANEAGLFVVGVKTEEIEKPKAPLFYLIAGEASGDLLGARLMHALRQKAGGPIRFAGVGGPRMAEEGIDLLFPQAELAHMGLFEIIRHVPHLLRRINQTAKAIKAARPAALITIDSPDFSFRVAKKLKGSGIPLIHYVAPTVWAWRPARAKKVAQFLDHLLALLPFEPPYFTTHGLACTFVGHPLVESDAGKGDGARFRSKHDIPVAAPLLAVLPGSRVGEVKRLLPIFRETIQRLHNHVPSLRVVIPTVPAVATLVQAEAQTWPVPVIFIEHDADKYDAFAASRAALACSGTVSVELAMAGLPTIIAYKANALTVALYRRLIRVKYATLLNIMQDRMVMPEYLQENCTPEKLTEAVFDLLSSAKLCEEQRKDLQTIGAWLGRGQFVPSEKAAETVWQEAFPDTKKPLRVLQIIPALGTGGAEQACVDITAALVARDDTAFVVSNGGRRVAEVEAAGGIHILRDVHSKKPWRIIANAGWLADVIRREKIDIVHARSRAPAWSAKLACRMTKTPFVTTFHAAYKYKSAAKKAYNKVMAQADRIIAISPYIAKHIRDSYGVPDSKIRLINRGVDTKKLDPQTISPLRKRAFCECARLLEDEKAILLPARLSPIKGQDFFIRVMAQLRKSGARVPPLLIIGDDQGRVAYRQSLVDLIKENGLEDSVWLLGAWSDMPAAYASAALVVVPSQVPEGFGRVPVEAMAMGVPVIASALGAMQDTIVDGETGWLVAPSDGEAWVQAVQWALALSPEEKEAMAKAGQMRARHHFNQETMATETLAVYDELAGRGRV